MQMSMQRSGFMEARALPAVSAGKMHHDATQWPAGLHLPSLRMGKGHENIVLSTASICSTVFGWRWTVLFVAVVKM